MLQDGFAYLDSETSRGWLTRSGALTDWDSFAASWDGMQRDTYMADGGRYRRRRHAVFAATQGGPIRRQPHQPHFQTVAYNTLNGGVARWFEPIPPTIGASESLTTILAATRTLFDGLTAHPPPGISSCTSSASRPGRVRRASRRRRGCTATAWISCWSC